MPRRGVVSTMGPHTTTLHPRLMKQPTTTPYIRRSDSSEECNSMNDRCSDRSERGSDYVHIDEESDSERQEAIAMRGGDTEELSESAFDVVPEEVFLMVEEISTLKMKVEEVNAPLDSDSEEEDGGGGGGRISESLPNVSREALAAMLQTDTSDGLNMSDLISRVGNAFTAAAKVYGNGEANGTELLGARYFDAGIARALWVEVANEIELVHSLAAYAISSIDAKGVDSIFEALCAQLVSSVCVLLTGSRSPGALRVSASRAIPVAQWLGLKRANSGSSSNQNVKEIENRNSNDEDSRLQVWASPREARAAILAETIRSAMAGEVSEHEAEPYAVLVIVDAVIDATIDDDDDVDGEDDPARHRISARIEAEKKALAEWGTVCDGLAECERLAVESGQHAVRTLNAALLSRGGVRPVLAVLHTATGSQISATAMQLRSTCDEHGVRLCIDGDALAMLAQNGRPPAVEMALVAAHALVLTPAAWLGFANTAALTWQPAHASQIETNRSSSSESVGNSRLKTIRASVPLGRDTQHDADPARALAPALALWWVLSRLGPRRIRAVVADASAAAETLVRRLKNIAGMSATVGGIGGVVRVSYAPGSVAVASAAAAAPGVLGDSGRMHVARVNRALYEKTKGECGALLAALDGGRNGEAWLSFAPASIVGARALWAPPAAAVDALVGGLDSAVRRVRVCAAARASFNVWTRAANNSDIEAASDAGVGDVFTFASFRVVPARFVDGWAIDKNRVNQVHEWTKRVFDEMTLCFDELIEGNRKFKRKVDSVAKMRGPYLSLFSRVVGSAGRHRGGSGVSDGEEDLPFEAFLQENQSSSSTSACWIGLVPNEDCKIPDAEIAAEIAAELVSYTVSRILGEDGGNGSLMV